MTEEPNVEPRVSLVTGGTQGIGHAVSLELARRGDRVLFVGRNERLGAATLSALHAIRPGVEHAFLPADLSLLSETARVANEVLERVARLDAVVHCAGILSTLPEWTAEALERSFVLNYLSRYLLTRRLLPALLAAPSGRVVLVSNAGKYGDTLDFDDLQHRRGKPGLRVSGRTQFANDLFAVELAARTTGTSLEVSCVFPGVVRTRVFENARGLSWFARALVPLLRLFSLSPERAAVTPASLARDPEAIGVSGRFFGPGRKEIVVPDAARRAERRALLWEHSAELVRDHLNAREGRSGDRGAGIEDSSPSMPDRSSRERLIDARRGTPSGPSKLR